MYHDQTHKNIRIPNCHSNSKSPILIHFHASYFNKLLLQIEHHRLPIHSVSSSNLEDEKLSKAFAYVKHGGCHGTVHFHASPSSITFLKLQHTISYVHKIHHTCIRCRPEYLHASILCHIHSATYWT